MNLDTASAEDDSLGFKAASQYGRKCIEESLNVVNVVEGLRLGNWTSCDLEDVYLSSKICFFSCGGGRRVPVFQLKVQLL